ADENVRAWAVRLLGDFGAAPDLATTKFLEMAKQDPSPLVRLHLASALQKMPVELNAGAGKVSRAKILEQLLAHTEDTFDKTLPLMYWYALEPLIVKAPTRAPLIGLRGRIALVRELASRRATELSPGGGLDLVSFALEDTAKAKAAGAKDVDLLVMEAREEDVLVGMAAALKGRRDVKPRFMWKSVSEKLNASTKSRVRKAAFRVAVVFGDTTALEKYREQALDKFVG